MYNRYIPQPDGSFRRNRMPEPIREAPCPPPPPPPSCEPPPKPEPCKPKPQQPQPGPTPPRGGCRPPRRPAPPPKPQGCQPPPLQGVGVGSFFRQLLPKGFDMEDLLIVLLLLLMAGDCREDQNTALLTLALYLFL